MSDFFNKVKEGFNKTTTFVSVKSSTLVESNKLKNEIASLSKQKRNLFSKIGEEIYKMKKEEGKIEVTNVEDTIQKIFDIDTKRVELEQKIKELAKKEEEALKNAETKPQAPISKTCSCGTKLSKDAKFCAKCGAKAPESIVVDVKSNEEAVEIVIDNEIEETVEVATDNEIEEAVEIVNDNETEEAEIVIEAKSEE